VNFLRFLMLLALAVWVGGLSFFPVFAGIAFSRLPQAHLAGAVVRSSLVALHLIGMVAGIVFLLSSFLYDRAVEGRIRSRLCHAFVVLMLALTAVSQFSIIPRMDTLRASAGEMAALPPGSPIRVRFDSLHRASVRLEGGVLVVGLGALYLTARRFASA
jgi:Domain of unknown function (DUF4149)